MFTFYYEFPLHFQFIIQLFVYLLVCKFSCLFTFKFENSALCLHFSRKFSCLFTIFVRISYLTVWMKKTSFLIFGQKYPFANVCRAGKRKLKRDALIRYFFYRSTCRFLCPKPILKRKMLIQSLRLMRSMRSTKNKYQKKAPQNCCFLKWFIAKVKALKDMIALFGLKASKGLLR